MNSISEKIEKGINFQKKGDFKEAEQLYSSILKKNPKHPDANYNLGTCKLSLNNGKITSLNERSN